MNIGDTVICIDNKMHEDQRRLLRDQLDRITHNLGLLVVGQAYTITGLNSGGGFHLAGVQTVGGTAYRRVRFQPKPEEEIAVEEEQELLINDFGPRVRDFA